MPREICWAADRMRRADEDTRNATYQAMAGKFMGVAVALNAACSFDTPEIMAISDEKLAQFYADCPKLERYRRYLTNLRRRKAHTLSAAEEKLLASAGEMSQAPDTIYGSLADADMKFPDAVDAKGNKHPLTQGTFVSLEESSDRVLRQSAYENLYGTLAAFKTTTAALLNAQNKQLKFFAEARKYDTAFEASLDATNVPTSVYKNLIETVHQNHGQDAPLCPPAQEAAGRGRAAFLRCVHPPAERCGPAHSLSSRPSRPFTTRWRLWARTTATF